MNLALSFIAAAVAAACGWPAAGIVVALSATPGSGTAGLGTPGAGTAGSGTAGTGGGPSSVPAPDPAAVAPRAGRHAAALTALIMAAVVLLVTLRLHQEMLAIACDWLVVCGLPLSLIDIRVRRLPDPLTTACAAGIAVALTSAAVADGRWHELARAGAGGAVTCAFFGLLALARPGSAGLGDAKLGFSTGALAAWFGWTFVLTALFTAFVLAACYGLGLLMTARASPRDVSVPFGPCLLAGCLAVVLLTGA